MPRAYRWWTTGELARCRQWAGEGLTFAAMARRLGRRPSAVRAWCSRHGIQTGRHLLRGADVRARLLRAIADGLSATAAYRAAGVCRTRGLDLLRDLERRGLVRRPSPRRWVVTEEWATGVAARESEGLP